MKIVAALRLILEILKELFSYGKKAENEKLEALVDDRRRDKLDWIDDRMSDTTEEAGRDQNDNPKQ
jgi:hypothetical protein|tara:strand:- start:60 stop:257 length:198 start_codon:yes stop_codon:yes gene_type:complete